MPVTVALPSSPIVDAGGNLRPEWRVFLQRVVKSLNAAAAVEALDGGTAYSNNQLRDKIIEIQEALGAD